jgi:hypothetical protein
MKTYSLGRASCFGAAVLGAALLAGNAAAGECGMGDDIDWYTGERALVAEADTLLDEGMPEDAGWVVQRAWHQMRDARPVVGSMPHIAEAVRVMALACVRTDGAVHSGFGWASATPADRAANVRWGVSRLRMLVRANPESSAAKVDLGEALGRSPATRAEASALLEAADVERAIRSPEGLLALARLRDAGGDPAGAVAARIECVYLDVSPLRCSDDAEPESETTTASR